VSKIFEALRKAEGELARLSKPLLEQGYTVEADAESLENRRVETPVDRTTIAPPRRAPIRTQAVRPAPNSPILAFQGSNSPASEAYKIIRAKILLHAERPRMLLVSSPMPGDGKTVSAINLAVTLALAADINVVLVDGDFRRSSIGRSLDLPAGPGLSEVLREEILFEQALVRVDQLPNLFILPAGRTIDSGAELLDSARWKSLCDRLRKQFQFSVLDAPPVGAVSDYHLLQLACDGVLLVVRPEHTDRQLCRHAVDTIPKEKQLGVILNCAEDWFLWKTHGYYYYSSDTRK
jgi:capsular exopolysaccharide synthesis family protein